MGDAHKRNMVAILLQEVVVKQRAVSDFRKTVVTKYSLFSICVLIAVTTLFAGEN